MTTLDLFGAAMASAASVLPRDERDALLSPCKLYRYTLTRRWGEGPPLLFVMLNPSTASATEDDPTIRRCVGYAKRDGFPAIEVVNLFALRATDPKALTTVADPIGPENDAHVQAAADRAGRIVAAWGKSLPRGHEQRPKAVLALLTASKRGAVYCIAKGDELPKARHPLYLKSDAPLVLLAGTP
jgi:hypothetical protein